MAKTKPSTGGERKTRAFKMHPKLLWDVITRQAGTLDKAILEAAMNAVDSGSTRVDVVIDRDKFSVKDDGKGFVDMTEIENFFETFGHPHEEGDATYGRFRMGRGQIFSFGANRWRSNNFAMDVDLKPQEGSAADGLNYTLGETSKPVKGCSIEVDLYKKLLPGEVDTIERDLARVLKYLQIPVTVNGKQVNTFPKDQKWSHETDDAYIDLKDTGELRVFNLGVFVRAYPASQFGTGGTIVTKSNLTLNFARNDVLTSECTLWKRIATFVRKHTATESVKKKKMTEAEWEALATDIRVGSQSLADVLETPMLRTVTGSMISFADLPARIERCAGRLALSPAKDHLGDKMLQHHAALVLDDKNLERFGYSSLKHMATELAKRAKKEADEHRSARDFSVGHILGRIHATLTAAKLLDRKEFGKYINADYEDVALRELNPAEKLAIKVIQKASNVIHNDLHTMVRLARSKNPGPWEIRQMRDYPLDLCQRLSAMCPTEEKGGLRWKSREVRAGLSDAAEGWTDGTSKVWINRRLLGLVGKGVVGMQKLASLMLHEYIHQNPSTGDGNVHSEEFYEMHHDLSIDTPIMGRTVNAMLEAAIRAVRQEDRKPTGALKKFENQNAELTGPLFDPQAKTEAQADLADADTGAAEPEAPEPALFAAKI